jgi:hypothetical protein
MARLYEPHNPALTTLYGDIENFARGQTVAFPGTPGGVLERQNAGNFKFYTHQYYDATGKKTDKYLAGPVGDALADTKAEELREKIAELNDVIKNLRLLGREGFHLADSKTFATAVSLHNRAVFEAGAMLVGSHAYGALLNQLGARAAQYATKDIDIARDTKLAFPEPLQKSFLEIIRESGIRFVEIPHLDKTKPASSFKEPGKSFFQVDLLVPADTDEIATVAVPELQAHATALPYLEYLLGESQQTVLLAREGCCMIRVPVPERFALHKLIVSRLRQRAEKAVKDISQACVLFAVLAERHPRALEDAASVVPASGWKHLEKASSLALEQLQSHPLAIETMMAILGGHGKNKKEKVTSQPPIPPRS